MIQIVFFASGERNAYRSVLSANGSSAISGASRWLEDIRIADVPNTATIGSSRHAFSFLIRMVFNFWFKKMWRKKIPGCSPLTVRFYLKHIRNESLHGFE